MNKELMQEAISLAKTAAQNSDVPVGAIVTLKGEVIGRGYNRREKDGDATAHAEIIAIREASKKLGSWRLDECEMYVTLEPCPMCAGAIINSRIKKLVFGAYEKKSGSASNDSVIDLFSLGYNHKPEVYGGICEKESAELLKNFFEDKR